MNEDETIWSGSDLTYACLIDPQRTRAFEQAIKKVVKEGDVVADIGSGTGILAYFAAKAGAKKVYAVEMDPFLCKFLRQSFKQNGLESVIEVVEGNALEVDLPKNLDVVIAELIETGLIEEMQAAVMNGLRKNGVIGPKTKVIPEKYETFIQFANIANNFYGFTYMGPIHNWPNYESENWEQFGKKLVGEKFSVAQVNFGAGEVKTAVDRIIRVTGLHAVSKTNALKLSGVLTLCDGIELGGTNTINGDKFLPHETIEIDNGESFRVHYKLGAGLPQLKVEKIN